MGEKTPYWLTGFAATMVTGLGITGVMCEQTLPYYLAVGLTAAHLGHQVSLYNKYVTQHIERYHLSKDSILSCRGAKSKYLTNNRLSNCYCVPIPNFKSLFLKINVLLICYDIINEKN